MISHSTDKEVCIIKVFNADRERVFKAWTEPELLKQWFAPEGCTISYTEIDIRIGGRYHSCIDNPEFGKCWCIGEYKEIIAPEKIVFTMINADENGKPIDPSTIGMDKDWPGETLVTITLTENHGQTTLTLRQTVSESLARKTGAYPSWLQMLTQINDILNLN